VLPGGHSEGSESPHDTFVREIQEETGLEIEFVGMEVSSDDSELTHYPTPVSNYLIEYDTFDRGRVKKFEYIFVARVTGGVFVLQDEEVHQARWFGIEEILDMDPDKNIHKHIQDMLSKVKKRL